MEDFKVIVDGIDDLISDFTETCMDVECFKVDVMPWLDLMVVEDVVEGDFNAGVEGV